jgi:hypothetical protein
MVEPGPIQVIDFPPIVEPGPIQVIDFPPIVEPGPIQVIDFPPMVEPGPIQVIDFPPMLEQGSFSKVTLPAEMQGWLWNLGCADGSSSTRVPVGEYKSATLMIPEPGTLVLLATGAFGVLLLVWRRRRKAAGRSLRL